MMRIDKGQAPETLDTELRVRLLPGIAAGPLGDGLLDPDSVDLAAES